MRSNDRVAASDKARLGLRVRKKPGEAARAAKREAAEALREAPRLAFVGATHRTGCVPEHELRFQRQRGPGRPAGALPGTLPGARLELFFELVPPDAAVPDVPGAAGYGFHYLRSFVKSPVVLRPPMADRPIRVVYWGRWADASGEVGPMSRAAAGWVEGGSHHLIGVQVPGSAHARPEAVDTARLAAVAARLPRLATPASGTEEHPTAEPIGVEVSVRGAPSTEGRSAAA